MIDLRQDQLKPYAKSSRACRYDSGYILEGRFGKISFDLNSFGTNTSITVFIKKLTGNGKLIINQESYTVSSRMGQEIVIKSSGLLEISRPNDSIGEINIYAIKLEMEDGLNTWKLLLNKCKYGAIRLAGDKLFANVGAFIQNVAVIETVPPNMFSKVGDQINFLGDCEIVRLELEQTETQIPINNTKLYTHMSQPIPVLPASPIQTQPLSVKSATSLLPRTNQLALKNSILYDSAINGFDKSRLNNNTVKVIRSNGQELLVIKKNGTYQVVVSALKPFTEYVVIVTLKKLNGNGKIKAGFLSGANQAIPRNTEDIIADSQFVDKYLTLNTGEPDGLGDIYRLALMMGADGMGEVLISKIRIINGISIENVRMSFQNNYYSRLDADRPISNTNVKYSVAIDNVDDSVTTTSKRYARYISVLKPNNIYPDVSNSFISTTSSGLNWLNKIAPFFPNIRLCRLKDKIESDTILIGQIGNLLPCSKIWIDAFNENEVTNQNLDILRECKVIFSPSLPNVQFLDKHCSKTLVIQMHKPLPVLDPQLDVYLAQQDFILTFNRHPATLRYLIDSWTEDMPKLAVVGARGSFPDFVIPISEYLSYDRLFYAIIKAKAVIDLPINTDYISSFLHLAHAAGTPILTTNWFAMDRSNCTFLIGDKVNNIVLPSKELMQEKIATLGVRAENTLATYNQNLLNGLTTMANVS